MTPDERRFAALRMLRHLEIAAFAEAITLAVLVLVAVPLKHLGGWDLGVRIIGPDGPVLERTGVAGTRFQYPREAPPLTAGVRYTFQLLPAWHPPQEIWFQVVPPERAGAIRRDLRDLDEALAAGTPGVTAVILRAGFLSGQEIGRAHV